MELNLNYLCSGVTTLGPGRRIGLWVQGCSHRCIDCMSPELFSREEGVRAEVKQVFEQILALAEGHDGLTVSGGEPFEQPEALCLLFSLIREHTSLDILVYSGYTMTEVLVGSQAGVEMLARADVLIDGRYRWDLPTNKLWRGSENQQMHLLSATGRKYQGFVEAEYGSARPLQVELMDDNGFQIIGIPANGDIRRLKEELFGRGITLKENNK
ncbi:4Fe-4S single cluster domain-containing protein [Dethiobacter alkaliphilus]|uniref:4Fe-4S single cluster domain-containing protein n=1 Tax=Dethiobacter alkaliphilus TaxID=427926 RepID=UPI0022261008|nr:4Fe-4S single cluster domain-containing protein [Dethiobacter alkaliphilus]MCW3488666.1 radical SAM protein [Dethiobacter alkaliphilus]